MLAAGLAASLLATPALAHRRSGDDGHPKELRACSATSRLAPIACRGATEDDSFIAIGTCINLSSADARKECKAAARTSPSR
jgi:hypothetical protein